jgi:biotin carboxyl carrier protein
MRYLAVSRGQNHQVVVERAEGGWHVRLDDREMVADVLALGPSLYSLLVDGRSYEVDVLEVQGALVVHVSGQPFRVELRSELEAALPAAGGGAASRGETVSAPMPGKVLRLLARAGDILQPGDGVAVIEAMKMENELKAVSGGRVREVRVAEGKPVNAGDVVAVLE